jgi:hypothetical protein
MGFQDFADFADELGLRLPIDGKTYLIPPIDAETGLWCQNLMQVGGRVVAGHVVTEEDVELLDDDAERSLYQRLLGPVHEQMVADNVPWTAIKNAALTVLWDATAGRETAEKFWNAGGQSLGEAAAPNRAQRRASTRGTSGGASTTRRRGSTTGTTPSTRAPRQAAKRSPGRNSSSDGL